MRFSLLPTFCLTLAVQSQDQGFESPCPRVFHYDISPGYNGLVHAHLTVPFPKRGSVIHTSLIMTIQGPYEGYQGELVLTRNRSEVIADILHSKIDVLEFSVLLPRLEPSPLLGVVLVNQVVICMGPMIVPYDEFTVLTSLTLNHFLHLGYNSSAVAARHSPTRNSTSVPTRKPVLPAENMPSVSKGPSCSLLPQGIQTTDTNLVHSGKNKTIPENTNIQEKTKLAQLKDIVNLTAVQAMRDYLGVENEEALDSESTEDTPHIDLRIDSKLQKLTLNNTDLTCSTFTRGSYPWIVAVYIKSSLGVQYHCTGNLISSRHVILAGHCLQENRGSRISAHQLILFFGKTKLSSWEDYVQTREVSTVFIHPNFDHYSYTSDVAILKFTTPVIFSHRVAPICLWTPEDTTARVGMVVGWGVNPKTHNFVPDILRPAIVQLIPWELCIQDRDLFYITSLTTLCAVSVDGTGPCNGDSGAGMVILDAQSNIWYLRALVSLAMVDQSTQRCDLNRSVVLTNVSKYQGWLQQVLTQD